MSITLEVPVLSPTAGQDNEGVVYGRMPATTLVGTAISIGTSTNVRVYRLDRTGGSLNIVNDSTVARSNTPNAWSPFGTNVIPSGATLKVYDSSDGVWASRELTVTCAQHANPLDCFRDVEWHKFSFGTTTTRQAWRPTSDPAANIPARKYIRVELNDGADNDSFLVAADDADIEAIYIQTTTAGSTTVANKAAMIEVQRVQADVAYRDTTSLSAGTTANPEPGQPANFLAVPDFISTFCFSTPAIALERYVWRRLGGPITYAAEYYTTAGTWAALPDFNDPGDFLQNDQAVQAADANPNRYRVTWSLPSDWASTTLTFANVSGGTFSFTGYFIRYRIITAPNAPVTFPLQRARGRQFGNANVVGNTALRSGSIVGVNVMRLGTSPASNVVCQTFNANTATGRTWTIPSGATGPLSFTFSSPITTSAGDELLPVVVNGGGGQATDVELVFVEGA